MPDDLRQDIGEMPWSHDDGMVRAAEMFHHHRGSADLRIVVIVSGGEGHELRLGRAAPARVGHADRIDSSAQRDSDAIAASDEIARRLEQQSPDALARGILARRCDRESERPHVLRVLARAVAREAQHRARRDRKDVPEKRPVTGYALVTLQVLQSVEIGLGGHFRERKERLVLAREGDATSRQHAVVERLQSDEIAREEERLRPLVPCGDGERLIAGLECGETFAREAAGDDGLRIVTAQGRGRRDDCRQ